MTPTDAGFDWHDYLELARELSKPLFGDLLCEAKIRSSMSRSYYAAYWTARVYLEAGGFVIADKDRSHDLVWKEFKGKGGIKQGIFAAGGRLKFDRVWADYERDCHCRVGDAERSLLSAECIIGRIRSLPAPVAAVPGARRHGRSKVLEETSPQLIRSVQVLWSSWCAGRYLGKYSVLRKHCMPL